VRRLLVEEIVLKPGEATAINLKNGDKLMIITMGGQTSDLSFKGLSQSITRERMGYEKYGRPVQSLRLGVGDVIYDTTYVPTLRIIDSSVEYHDVLWPGCSRAMFKQFYNVDKDGCRDLLRRVLELDDDYDLEVVSFFMRLGENYEILPSTAKPGDYVTLLALRDIRIGVTACPDDLLANPTPSEIRVRLL